MHFESIYLSHFAGITLMVMAERFKAKMLSSGKEYLVLVAYFSSVFFHELSHYLVSLLLGGKPSNFTIIPLKREFEDNDRKKYVSWEFGSVLTNNITFVNAVPISFAPLLLLPIAYYVYVVLLESVSAGGIEIVFAYFLIYAMISSSLPSVEDIKVGLFATKTSALLYLVLFVFIYLYNQEILGVYYEIKSFSFSVIG